MRSPVKTEKSLRQDAAFEAVKKETGMTNMFDSGWKEMHARFNAVYKDGMTAEETVIAYKGK